MYFITVGHPTIEIGEAETRQEANEVLFRLLDKHPEVQGENFEWGIYKAEFVDGPGGV
jgi:hypothetical protein